MPLGDVPIFRADAVRRYRQDREKAVLPRWVSPRTFLYLWALLTLLVASGGLVWCAQVPVYVSGPAVVVHWRETSQDLSDAVVVVAFVPPAHLPRLRVGQTLSLTRAPADPSVSASVIIVEPDVISPDAAQRRFGLGAGAALAVTQPAVVVMARWDPVPAGLPAAMYAGSVYRGDIAVGSRRLLGLVPLLGPLFGE